MSKERTKGSPGPPPTIDLEAAFDYFYNAGRRRTLQAVAERFECGYNTIRRHCNERDWYGRADAIDLEARKQRDKRIASIIGQADALAVESAAATITLFAKRLKGEDSTNPMSPDDVGVREFAEAVKTLQLVTGGATERAGTETRSPTFDGMEDEIAWAEAQAEAKIQAELKEGAPPNDDPVTPPA